MSALPLQARFAHTNLVARDWRRLAAFYRDVFGCVPVPPERDLEGEWLDKGSGIAGAHIRGVHLRLPGQGENGPTLELFQYERPAPRTGEEPVPEAPNRPGLGHLAFSVPEVAKALEEVIRAGGSALGEIVRITIPEAGVIEWTYARDPEGNILELQRWGGA
jgi:catechol 2,3-dioxygenase-like lactoylglutathione lyase family enzyme